MSRRLPVVFVLTFGAGLLVGLSRFLAPGLVLTGLVFLLTRRMHPAIGFLLGAVALGLLSGAAGQAGASVSCSARLPAGRLELLIEPLEPVAAAGGTVRLRLPDVPCVGSIRGRWSAGEVPKEARLRVVAKWIPRRGPFERPSGVLIVEEVTGRLPGRSFLVGVRKWLDGTVAELYGSRAGLVNALILNRKQGLDSDVRDTFAKAGVIHLLAISGFHVGVLTLWVLMGSRATGMRRSTASAVASGVILAYVALLGWPPAATRAAILATLLAWTRTGQRRVATGPLVACTCLVLLVADPWSVTEFGAWLSVTALAGVITFGRWGARVGGDGAVVRTIAASVGATLLTAPITAAAFGVVSLVGIPLNLVAIPLTALALPAVIASVIVYPVFQPLGVALAASGGLLLEILTRLAHWAADVPAGHVVQAQGVSAAVPWVMALAIGLWLIGRGNTLRESFRRALWTGAVLLWVAVAWPHGAIAPGSGLELHFLDVGQGDGAAIRTPGGSWVLIDGGPRNPRWDAGRQVVVPFLKRHGVRRLEAVVVSHADADHLGGLATVLRDIPTALVLEPGGSARSELYVAFLDEVAAAGIRWRRGRAGDRFVIDDVEFTLLHPDTVWAGWGEGLNENSIVLLVKYGDFEALFSGDIGFPAEQHLRGGVGSIEVLKVGHHGSDGSTGIEWLEELSPVVSVVSVGTNRYGHPTAGALDRLRAQGSSVWRTDELGHITIRTDGHQVTVSARGREETLLASTQE